MIHYSRFVLAAGHDDGLGLDARRDSDRGFGILWQAVHGGFDFFLGHVIANAGMPPWWPEFRLSDDVTAAVYPAGLIRARCRHAPDDPPAGE